MVATAAGAGAVVGAAGGAAVVAAGAAAGAWGAAGAQADSSDRPVASTLPTTNCRRVSLGRIRSDIQLPPLPRGSRPLARPAYTPRTPRRVSDGHCRCPLTRGPRLRAGAHLPGSLRQHPILYWRVR